MAAHLEFSEFTYGFALVENLTRDARLKIAPVFPSLLQEGTAQGGYDVSLDEGAGLPLLLQFKVPKVLNRRSRLAPAGFPKPYYRVELRCRPNEDGFSQHSVLLNHESQGRDVFYAAPCFHRTTDLDARFAAGSVVEGSAFFSPSDIGPLEDYPHHVAYCDTSSEAWLRSEPVRLPNEVSAATFTRRLIDRLEKTEEKRFSFRRLLEDMVNAAEMSRAEVKPHWRSVQGSNEDQRLMASERRAADEEPRRMPPREFARSIADTRSAPVAAATFARVWMGAELLVVDSL